MASSADRKVINAVLTKFGLMDCFEYILSGAELPASKPNPAIYQLTAKALGFAPADCVVIEDATAGIMAAKDAGAYCIAYDIQILAHKIYLVLIKSFLHYPI
mgnify:CR=1 FL=1